MASRREQNMKYRRYSGRVNGNLAYDPAYEERQRRLRREQEYEREHQREEFMRPPQRMRNITFVLIVICLRLLRRRYDFLFTLRETG